MVASAPPSRQSSPLIDASMRPPRVRPASSRRPVLALFAAFICLLVLLMRGQRQSTELQRPPIDANPQQHSFDAPGEQKGQQHTDQQAAEASSGNTGQPPHGSGQKQAQPGAEGEPTADAIRGVKPPKKPAGKTAQQQAAEQQPEAAADPTDAAGSKATAAEEAHEAAEQPQQQKPKQTNEQQQQQQQQAQAHRSVGDGQGSGSDSGESGSGSEGEGGSDEGQEPQEQESGPTGGWSDSFLKTKVDGHLGNLLDMTSLMSPLRTCAADGFSLEVHETEAEDLLADKIDGRPTTEAQQRWANLLDKELKPTLVSGTAHNLPCAARRNNGSCCRHPVSFRRNTTDYRVFKQVFQCHYMRYLYTLFGDQPPKYVLDAGANAGFSTILFKLLWPEATVVMLEPDPANFDILRRNTATLKDVHPINAGLWGRTANITVKANHGNWGKVFQEAEEGQSGMPAYSVADVARRVGIPAFDFVKIDIEGAEGQVFAPGRDVSWIKQARAVSLELHDFFANYFGLRSGEISARVDAAFSPTGYTPVSDNEHIIYLNPELQASVAKLREPPLRLVDIRKARLKKINGC